MGKIRDYLNENGASKTSELAQYIGLSEARTRAILAIMDDIEAQGNTTNRTYRLGK